MQSRFRFQVLPLLLLAMVMNTTAADAASAVGPSRSAFDASIPGLDVGEMEADLVGIGFECVTTRIIDVGHASLGVRECFAAEEESSYATLTIVDSSGAARIVVATVAGDLRPAKAFLGLLSTTSYRGAEPDTALAWTATHAGRGSSARFIGDAFMRLDSSVSGAVLTIMPRVAAPRT